MTNYPLMGVVKIAYPFFSNLVPSYIFGISEARHFQFHVLIDTEEY